MTISKKIDDRVRKLEGILEKLDSQKDLKAAEDEAIEFLNTVTPEELSLAEQNLVDRGYDPSRLKKLCDIHLQLFTLEENQKGLRIAKDHPVGILMGEHEVILEKLDRLAIIKEQVQSADKAVGLEEEYEELDEIVHHLLEAENHHRREEEALFPPMEDIGVTGPPRIMRLEHKELLKRKEQLKDLLNNRDKYKFESFKKKLVKVVNLLVPQMKDHIYKENNILYPTAVEVLPPEEWEKIKGKSDDIGYCCFSPGFSD